MDHFAGAMCPPWIKKSWQVCGCILRARAFGKRGPRCCAV